MATRIPAAEARKHMADIVQQAQNGERIKLTRYDKTVAILIPKNDLTSLEKCEEENRRSPAPARRTKRTSPAIRKRVGK